VTNKHILRINKKGVDMPANNTFKREISSEIIKNLKKENLFKDCLLEDVKNGVVFPAIRDEYIDFYYKGGRLFTYDGNKFSTHIKYASVIGHDKFYISEVELKNTKFIPNFINEYTRIKENCSNYSGVEASGVSELYSKYSILNKSSNISVLDIEIAFAKIEENSDEDHSRKGQDRIDLLLYNKEENKLRFYEAKHFTNSEIWASGKPKVIDQLERYNGQLSKRYDDILSGYKEYIKTLNSLFDTQILEPIEIDTQVVLLVFGFDIDQKQGRLKDLEKVMRNNKHPYYFIGDIKKVIIDNMWKAIK